MAVKLIAKKGSTFHDFPYSSPLRKCFHCWIINVTPPGPSHCMHQCLYCYAREAVYSNHSEDTLVYDNLPELVERDLKRLRLCPPVSVSNVSDPCQDIPELRGEVRRLVALLVRYSVSFAITTKGDPSFLLEVPGFVEHPNKFVAVTIEGTDDVLRLVSPRAPSFQKRLEAVRRLTALGVSTVVRFDPAFVHLFQALYGERWFGEVANLVDAFAAAGARHIVSSTGRLSRRRSPGTGNNAGSYANVLLVIQATSRLAADKFREEYVYESAWAGGGYFLRRDLRADFHQRVRELVEARGMTYATCQELPAAESDSRGIPHCEGLALPFALRAGDGRFHPIEGCSANCHVSCRGLLRPPCGVPGLASPRPLRFADLR